MALYDVIEDISEKQILKTETGDNRIFGVVVGSVAKNYSESMPGRICVTIPTRDQEADELKWARMAMPSSGSEWGHYFLPEIGDQVLIVFEQGNIEKPYVIGCIPKDSDKFLKKSADEKNTKKRIVTKHGSSILFTDADGEGTENGEKDVIEVLTPGGERHLVMDNEKKTIILQDKEKKNSLEINTEKGLVSIAAEKKVEIKVGDEITLTLNGSNGTAELKAKKFKVSEADAIELNANKQFKANAASASVEGSSSVKVSGGPVTISGSPIKLG